MLNRATILRTINQGRNALRRDDTSKAQGLLAKAADSLGMGWIMWSSPMPAFALTHVALELLKRVDPIDEPQVSES